MIIFYLLISLIVMFFIFYKILNKNIFAPACIVILSYIFAVLCACVNINYWKIDLSLKTYWIIVGGVFSFALGNVLVSFVFKTRIKKEKNKNIIIQSSEYKPIPIHMLNIILIIIYDVIGIFLYYTEVKRIGGGSNFVEMMFNYRMNVGYEGMYVSSIVNQIIRLITAFSVVSIYIFMYNVIMAKQKIKQNSLLLIPVALDLAKSILTSGRYTFLQVVLEIVVLYAIFYYQKNQVVLSIRPKIILLGITTIAMMLVVFYAIRLIVGRNSQDNILNYVTSYFGGTIELLDLYVKDYNGPTSETFGGVTFTSLYKYLCKFLEVNINYGGASEFRRSVNGILIGNVYTTFRSYLQDFGYFGVGILSFLSSIVLSAFYYCVLITRKTFPKIVYAYLSYGVFLHSYSEQFFKIYLSIDIWMIVFLIYIALIYLTKVRVKI